MSQFDIKMTELADAIKAKNTSVSGKLSVQEMITAVDGIVINPPSGEGVDVSGVTATPADVLAGKTFVDSSGTLLEGSISEAAEPTTQDNVVTVPAGYVAQTQTLTVAEMSEPSVSANVVTIGKGYNKAQKTVTIPEATITNDGETATISAGYVKTPQQFNLGGGGSVDLSFVTAGAGDILTGKVGADANGNPVYGTLQIGGGGGSSDCQFYICTGYDGVVEKIVVTAGAITDDMDEPVSLIGEYNIVDPAAIGTARKWYCEKTTASGDYPAYNYGVTIGCAEIEMDWDDDGPVYDRKWGIGSGTSIDEWCWLIAPSSGIDSPFQVQWQNNSGYVAVTPVLTSDIADAAPYGPTGWKGRPIVNGDTPVFFSFGGGAANVNGFWEQIAGSGLTKQAKWQLIGSDSMIQYDTGGSFSGERWALYARDSKNKVTNMYLAPVEPNDIKHPGVLVWSNSGYGPTPLPTFVYAESGYSPANNVVSGLTYTEKLPEIGEFWNGNATIKAEKFFPA